MDKKNFAGRILQLTLEIIYLLTGEDYITMKKSSDHVTNSSHSGQRKNQNSPMEHRRNEQKILEVANGIIHLLTGEVLSCLEECEEQPDLLLDEQRPLIPQDLCRSSRKREPLHIQIRLPNRCEEDECIDGSHQESKVTKGHEGSAIAKPRTPTIGCLQDTDKFQLYPLCPSTPTPCARGAADSASDHENLEYTLVPVKEDGDLEEGQCSKAETLIRNQCQAHEDRSSGKCLNMQSQRVPAEGHLSESSPTIPKAKSHLQPSPKPNRPLHRGSSFACSPSSVPCDREEATSADRQDPQFTLSQVKEDSGFGKRSFKGGYFARAEISTPKHIGQFRPYLQKSRRESNADNHHEDVEYMLVDIKEESMLEEEEKGDSAEVKTLQSIALCQADEDGSQWKDSINIGSPLHFLDDDEESSGQLSLSSTPKSTTLNYQCTDCPTSFTLLSELLQHQTVHQESIYLTRPSPADREPSSSARPHKDLDYVLVDVKEECDAAEKECLEEDFSDSEMSPPEDGVEVEASEAEDGIQQEQTIACGKSSANRVYGSPAQLGTSSPIPNSKIYRCLECPDVFNCRSDLLKHQSHHRGSTLFSCSICGKNFTSKSNLAKHHKIHTGEKPYSCTQCGKSFREKHYLLSHQSVHSGAQLITCSVCGKGYTSKSNLAKHQRIHTGQKPFACSLCSKSFNQRSVLLVHQRTHTGEKPFLCQLCERRFTDKLQLERHQIKHTGVKPFSCSQCGKTFSRKHGLVKHLASH